MPTDRPTAAELLIAVREHLIEHLAPTLKGQPSFHLRVATNALAIVERTMNEGDGLDLSESSRLQELLDENEDLLTLNNSLANRIRSEHFDDSDRKILDHLRQTSIDKLKLANPRYMIPRD